MGCHIKKTVLMYSHATALFIRLRSLFRVFQSDTAQESRGGKPEETGKAIAYLLRQGIGYRDLGLIVSAFNRVGNIKQIRGADADATVHTVDRKRGILPHASQIQKDLSVCSFDLEGESVLHLSREIGFEVGGGDIKEVLKCPMRLVCRKIVTRGKLKGKNRLDRFTFCKGDLIRKPCPVPENDDL